MAFARRLSDRAGTTPLGSLVVAFTVAQLLDLASALVVAREINPIVASLVSQPILAS